MFKERHIRIIAETLRFDLQQGLSKTDFRLVCEKFAFMLDCYGPGIDTFNRTQFDRIYQYGNEMRDDNQNPLSTNFAGNLGFERKYCSIR